MKTVASLVSIPPAERTVPEMLRRQAEKFGGKMLAGIGDFVLSFRDAPDVAARSAGLLAQAGVGPGDRVAVICSNRKELVELFLGCGWLGAVIVPINTASRGAQLRHVLENSGARLLAVQSEFLPALELVDLGSLPIDTIWVIGGGEGGAPQGLPRIAAPMPTGGEPVPAAQARPGDTLAILYTSGTTGPSKGVCCPHAQFYLVGHQYGRLLEISDRDVLCTTLPLFHINALGTLFQALLSGATVIYEPRFSASGFWQMLVRHRATVSYLLGAMVPILLSRPPVPEERQHQVRIALAPGVPAQANTEFVKRTGVALLDGYGSTETNFVIGGSADRQTPGTMGPIFEGFEARVVDDDDNDVPDGEAGELVLRADRSVRLRDRLFQDAGEDRRGLAESLVSLRRSRGARGRRHLPIRRSAQGRHPAPRREHLLVRGRAGAAQPFGRGHGSGFSGSLGARRGRGHGGGRSARGSKLTELELIALLRAPAPLFRGAALLEFVDELPAHRERQGAEIQTARARRDAEDWDREASGYKLKR